MKFLPIRSLVFAALSVTAVFSCKPSGSSNSGGDQSEVQSLDQQASLDGSQGFSLADNSADVAPCPKPAADAPGTIEAY